MPSRTKNTHTQKRAVIIGGGVSGLATAALLGQAGFSVDVVDKNSSLGGRMSTSTSKGFRFDRGPSWYLMPDVFEHFFARFGKTPSDFFTLQRLTPSYRAFFEDTSHVDMTGNPKQDAQTVETLEPGSSSKFTRFLHQAEQKYRIAMDFFLYRNIDRVSDLLRPNLIIPACKLGILDALLPVDRILRRFFQSEKIRQLISYSLVFLGASPMQTPGIYSMLAHVDFNMGVFYPMGGMIEITKALIRLGNQSNVRYHKKQTVKKIRTRDHQAVGITLEDGTKIDADVVIAATDYAHAESLLAPHERQYSPSHWDHTTYAYSAFLLYLGLDTKIPGLLHHNIIFSQNWEKHFDALTGTTYPLSPSIYVGVPSKSDPSVAPKGCENIFVLVPIAPHLPDTPHDRSEYAQHILDRIETITKTKIRSHIITQEIFTGSDFTHVYNSSHQSALGIAHTLLQTSIFRPRNKSSKVERLYMVGADTVPGIGVPTCLISAELVVDRILKGFT